MKNYLNLIGKKAKRASFLKIDTKMKNKVLKRYILLLEKKKNSIIKANKKDRELAVKKKNWT